ncbi:hypothetical protein BDV24DRAFT_128332 [Aspergillus arachidicola]|uniref:Uncharacterized protein n=1 Tax=Aspergillus arachidicola TaxID=656916 RepID=A0A2G7G794_9EURO|nr:hypothetical protein BDV24DRAFT_128332 [Aspergillus arachidicola]PIG88689.1 hypothetical protein AARAC_000466 [Aspergillus arachidicola]
MTSRAWIEDGDHRVEGHTLMGTLRFQGEIIWEHGCHPNTVQLVEALYKLDRRFTMAFEGKERSIEGHTKLISVESGGSVILDRLSTHSSMEELVTAVNVILDGEERS